MPGHERKPAQTGTAIGAQKITGIIARNSYGRPRPCVRINRPVGHSEVVRFMSKVADHVYDFVKTRILSGELEQGAPLREEEVAELCGVSRTPVRDAIKRLEADLFVQRSESQRTFVATWSPEDIEEIFTLRAMIESYVARRAADRATPENIAALEDINRQIVASIEAPVPDIEAFLAGNRAFHATILDMASSDRLSTLLNRLILQPIVQRTATRYDREELARSANEHDELITALRRHDASWAASVMTAHIRRAFHSFSDHAATNRD